MGHFGVRGRAGSHTRQGRLEDRRRQRICRGLELAKQQNKCIYNFAHNHHSHPLIFRLCRVSANDKTSVMWTNKKSCKRYDASGKLAWNIWSLFCDINQIKVKEIMRIETNILRE